MQVFFERASDSETVSEITEKRSDLAMLLAKNTQKSLASSIEKAKQDGPAGNLARGEIFELTGSLENAIDSYDSAFEPGNSLDPLARKTIALLKAKRYSEALASAVTLSDIDPNHRTTSLGLREEYSSMSLLGDALLLNSRPTEAEKAFKKALELNDQDAFSATRLAHLFLASDRTEEALGLKDLVDSTPRAPEVSIMLARAQAGDVSLFEGINVTDVISYSASNEAGRPFIVSGENRKTELSESASVWEDE